MSTTTVNSINADMGKGNGMTLPQIQSVTRRMVHEYEAAAKKQFMQKTFTMLSIPSRFR